MEISKKKISLVMLVAVLVIMATSFGPSVVLGRDLYVSEDGLVSSGSETASKALSSQQRTALFNIMMESTIKGTGDKCNGGFCMFSPMSCAPGCGCLYPAGVCYGTCCK
ncbi:hypothetical protein FNV43_RR03353 [Rhamnella rubrinervis]|uniref:Uncharacterized protein n=1 Tax=Rhamnella rubrinervis TaxID=2594499 RepID=A0A8K0HIB1_9ROSA|nr:hypothetical protein FNV43_RR03353 [Rhamnella rubrinervis]